MFFWADVKVAIGGVGRLAQGKVDTKGARLALHLGIATIPVVIFGLFLKLSGLDGMLRSVTLIGWTMLIFGLVLYWTDQRGATTKTSPDWSTKDALIMGLWQAIALIPGTSRSGATISGARHLGYAREDAARLSMLMSIPTIIASGAVLGLDVISTANVQLAKDSLIAAVFAFFAALLALSLMMRLLKAVSFTPYVIYRIILGIALLAFAYS
ncbi:UNVERIFIED_CONTAM: hypothetical protein GTU68_019686 [Idotea baltica]|nr:hypothetical protein [Idotea baltica]